MNELSLIFHGLRCMVINHNVCALKIQRKLITYTVLRTKHVAKLLMLLKLEIGREQQSKNEII